MTNKSIKNLYLMMLIDIFDLWSMMTFLESLMHKNYSVLSLQHNLFEKFSKTGIECGNNYSDCGNA